jgi:hypothetical protein
MNIKIEHFIHFPSMNILDFIKALVKQNVKDNDGVKVHPRPFMTMLYLAPYSKER